MVVMGPVPETKRVCRPVLLTVLSVQVRFGPQLPDIMTLSARTGTSVSPASKQIAINKNRTLFLAFFINDYLHSN